MTSGTRIFVFFQRPSYVAPICGSSSAMHDFYFQFVGTIVRQIDHVNYSMLPTKSIITRPNYALPQPTMN